MALAFAWLYSIRTAENTREQENGMPSVLDAMERGKPLTGHIILIVTGRPCSGNVVPLLFNSSSFLASAIASVQSKRKL